MSRPGDAIWSDGRYETEVEDWVKNHDHSAARLDVDIVLSIAEIDPPEGEHCIQPNCKDEVKYSAIPIYRRMGDEVMDLAETYLCCYHAGVINP